MVCLASRPFIALSAVYAALLLFLKGLAGLVLSLIPVLFLIHLLAQLVLCAPWVCLVALAFVAFFRASSVRGSNLRYLCNVWSEYISPAGSLGGNDT